jgi:hypothetical protein
VGTPFETYTHTCTHTLLFHRSSVTLVLITRSILALESPLCTMKLGFWWPHLLETCSDFVFLSLFPK